MKRILTILGIGFLILSCSQRINDKASISALLVHYKLRLRLCLEDNLVFKPSAMFRMVENSPISLELTGALAIHDRFEIGDSI